MFLTRAPISVLEFFGQEADPSCGAVATFTGVVRDRNGGKVVERLYYESYEAMANQEIELIIDDVRKRWRVSEIRLVHRLGWLRVGEVAVAIWVSGEHRDETFSACREVIDRLKTQVPIWKKEVYAARTSEWVLCPHAVEVEA